MADDPGRNLLLELLAARGGGVAELKAIFRRLSKLTHPDRAGGGDEAFLRLRADFEEALAFLRARDARGRDDRRDGAEGGAGVGKGPVPPRATPRSPAEARRKSLALLRSLAMKSYTKEGPILAQRLSRELGPYDHEASALVAQYKAAFVDCFPAWRGLGEVFYADALFLALVMQLSYFLETGSARPRKLLSEYSASLALRAAKLEPERRAILEGLGAWIRREAEKGPA